MSVSGGSRGYGGMCSKALNLNAFGFRDSKAQPRATTTVNSHRGSAGACFELQVHHDMRYRGALPSLVYLSGR